VFQLSAGEELPDLGGPGPEISGIKDEFGTPLFSRPKRTGKAEKDPENSNKT
jgi:hypothetical protein